MWTIIIIVAIVVAIGLIFWLRGRKKGGEGADVSATPGMSEEAPKSFEPVPPAEKPAEPSEGPSEGPPSEGERPM